MRFLILTILLVLATSPASAEPRQVKECGKPVSTTINTTAAYDYCDMYSRQIAYAPERRNLRRQIDERRESYNAPRAQALAAYDEWKSSLYPEPTTDLEISKEAPQQTARPAQKVEQAKELSITERLNLEQLAKITGNR